jgi:hypothetical protein
MGNKRSDAIDAAVENAVRGKPAPVAPPAGVKKPIWERMGMTLEEYQRAQAQRAQADRARAGQTNPGN